MGIPSYFSYVLKNHTKIIKRLNTIHCNTLLMDANSFIYDVVYELKDPSYDQVYEGVYQKIKELVSRLKAKNVFVAFDGVAPFAKMKQQKQRRYKSWITKQILNKDGFNTNIITPGTNFMIKLDEYLKPRFEKDGYMFSGSSESGEGEHKLFDYLRKSSNKNDTYVVYGLDADLIMLSLLQVNTIPKLYLYRETKHFSYLSGINLNEHYVFNVNEMAIQIGDYLEKPVKQAVEDYCLLCFLCGNDFLPHFPSINIRNNGIQYLLDIYKTQLTNENLVSETKIHWSILKKLFNAISLQENELIVKNIEWKKGLNVYSKNKEDQLNHLPMKDNREEYLLKHLDRYYPVLFGQTDSKSICRNYLTMFEWTWQYYHGICKNNTICYEFHLAPLFSSLCINMPCFDEEFVTENKINISSMTQLAFVLPYSDYESILSNSIIKKMEKRFPQLCRNHFPIHYDFCKFFWESHVDFDYVDIQELEKIVRSEKI
jgi:5'-3' exonuclease